MLIALNVSFFGTHAFAVYRRGDSLEVEPVGWRADRPPGARANVIIYPMIGSWEARARRAARDAP